MTQDLLVSLSLRHEEALELFLSEFDANPDQLHGYFFDRNAPITDIVSTLRAWSAGKQLIDGWVPNSTWFWEVGETLQGVINVRHELTPWLAENAGHIGYSVATPYRHRGVATAMLRAALGYCSTLGISQPMLICDSENIGSIRAIESNSGVLEREGWNDSRTQIQRWYRMDL
jgi:predicted acetyltransferase